MGGGRTGWVRAAAPAEWQGGAALAPWDPALPPRRGYRLRPLWVGRRGDLQGAINGRAFVVCSPIEIHPFRGGGRAGGGDGGSVRHRSRLGTPEQGGRWQGAINGRAFVVCPNLLGAHPLGGGRTGMGAGGSPCGVARAGGFAVGPALATPQGLPTAPNMGGAEGD